MIDAAVKCFVYLWLGRVSAFDSVVNGKASPRCNQVFPIAAHGSLAVYIVYGK